MQPHSAQQTTSVGEQREQLQFDMHGKWALLEPDPTTLSSLLPLDSMKRQPKPPLYDGLFDDLFDDIIDGLDGKKSISELQLSTVFISRVNDAKKIFAWHVLLPVDTKGDLNDPSNNKVDVGAYWRSSAPKDDRPHWELQRLWLEFKKDEHRDDGFDDDNLAQFEARANFRQKIRGQLIAYAEMVMKQQQRTHLFSVFILGNCGRILRWDRAGACVTKKFDYVKHPEILGEFFWRFSHSTLEMQGHDPSAVLVKPGTKEYRLMQKMSIDGDRNQDAPFDYIRELFAASLEEGWPRYKLEVKDKKKGTRYFLVAKPQFTAPGLAGRGTRSYVAIDIEEKVFVHLKDQWRYDFPNVLREGDVLEMLNYAGVSNVPTLVCHGDVREQCTETQDRWTALPESVPGISLQDTNNDKEEWKPYPPKRHMHYRIVEKEVGKSLKEFKDSLSLVKHILDGVTAHEEAVEKAGILHRDVSAGNLLIYPVITKNTEGIITEVDWHGLLNDWELSKPVIAPGTAEEARHSDRTGTWQFMSAHILDNRYRSPSIEDELESFFHVLLYYGIRFLPHNQPDVGQYMNSFFDNYTYDNGEYKCGSMKQTTMASGHIRVKFGNPGQDHPLNRVIDTLLLWFSAYYRVVEHDELSGASPGSSSADSTHDCSMRFIEENREALRNFALEAAGHQLVPPIEKDRNTAANLSTHFAMRKLLTAYVVGWSWPANDKSEKDQLPADYSPMRQRGSKGSKYTQKTNTMLFQASQGTKRGSEVLGDELLSSNKRRRPSPLAGPSLQS
ncbi:hypothetical protein A0H81_06280 [Grifola frondosa]|uniref:Fungal-type protein kinase domain-containing protein n=1 Tax=Grifola frondosa TaxID=5627 RepID=A0A1C7MAZ0_GRIFR|nr:hypothetical protein A0H81_06280 [Grifola frondosa]